MSLAEHFRKAAQDAADSVNDSIANLDTRLAEIEKEKADIEAKRMSLRGVFQRLAQYPVKLGSDYLCPLCWVEDGRESPLRPIPSQDSHDIFRCAMCHYEAAVSWR